jgi:hypothetical protein
VLKTYPLITPCFYGNPNGCRQNIVNYRQDERMRGLLTLPRINEFHALNDEQQSDAAE